MLERKKWSHVIVHLNPRHVLYMCIIISVIMLPFSLLNVLVLVCCENMLNFLMCLFSVFN